MKLLEMKESLCLANPTSPNELDIWVRKGSVEIIWVKFHKIRLHSIVNRPTDLTSFFHGKFLPWLVACCNIKLGYLLIQPPFYSLHWYNLDTNEMKHIASFDESAGELMQPSIVKN
ncbi:hypothetical protein Pint_06887 [Pistacia integerrima]|uniref:Uncharacterized protein n=1 Tax=Pistacia integerrima TaxID=434235 RepID=A0ACC0XRP5_9ROSI|nr:hypothetical protein Pint_06887 [Pistacia integerrima]